MFQKRYSYEYHVERKIHLLKDYQTCNEISQNVYNTPIRKHTHTHTHTHTHVQQLYFHCSHSKLQFPQKPHIRLKRN
jgi:hypothetical protein